MNNTVAIKGKLEFTTLPRSIKGMTLVNAVVRTEDNQRITVGAWGLMAQALDKVKSGCKVQFDCVEKGAYLVVREITKYATGTIEKGSIYDEIPMKLNHFDAVAGADERSRW